MIEIKLDNKTIELQEYMTVDQYQRLQTAKVFEDKIDSKKLLSIYLNVKEEELKDAPLKEVEFIEKIVFNRLTADINEEIIMTFDINGTTYGFENNWKQITWGFWTDLEFFTAENITENIHRIMAILYRPVKSMKGVKYELEPYKSTSVEERAELFKQAPIKAWFGAARVFFYISARYTHNIKNTLEWGNKMKKWIMTGYKTLPQFLQKKLSLDTILDVRLNLPKKMLQE